MSYDPVASANDVCSRAERVRVTNTSVANPWWKIRLGVVEIVLCLVIPIIGLVAWTQYDTELQSELLAAFKLSDHAANVNAVYDMCSAGDDTVLSLQSDGQVQFWDISRGRRLGEVQSHLSDMRNAACCPCQKLLAVGSVGGKMEVWDLDHPEQPIATGTVNMDRVEACEFTRDGKLLVTAGERNEIVFWEPRTLCRLFSLQSSEPATDIRSLKFTRDGEYLLSGNRCGTIDVWSVKTRSLVRRLPEAAPSENSATWRPEGIVEALLVLPNDREVVAVSRCHGISVWNLTMGKCVRHWAGGPEGIYSAALSADGKRLVTGSDSGTVATWDIASGRLLKSVAVHAYCVRSLACNADASMVLSGDLSGGIKCRVN